MSVPNRAALITKTFKVIKKHYQPVAPASGRSLFEHLLYASCLENSRHEAADEAFAKIQDLYYDWNEIRVTTVAELAETMSSLPDPKAGATRLKRVLQSIFETHYAFDLESLKKENIGAAVKKLQRYQGVTPFAVSYVTQHALGGHAIGVDRGALDTLYVIGIITEAEAKQGRVPGMERAIPKTKGVEFASLLHQLGADYFLTPFSPRVRQIIMDISPTAKSRFPKRGGRKGGDDEEQKTGRRGGKKHTKSMARTAKKTAKKKPPPKSRPRAAAKTDGARKKSTTKRLSKKKPR